MSSNKKRPANAITRTHNPLVRGSSPRWPTIKIATAHTSSRLFFIVAITGHVSHSFFAQPRTLHSYNKPMKAFILFFAVAFALTLSGCTAISNGVQYEHTFPIDFSDS